MIPGFLETFGDFAGPGGLAGPMDVAVVIPTLLRPTLRQALHSIFAQRAGGRVHVLVGIDMPAGDLAVIAEACTERPSHCVVQVYWPGYSTAVAHGGLTPAGDGGALRAVLTYLAHAPFVAYLDDDNWWGPDHLHLMRAAMDHADWAFALRWFVHPASRRPICIDTWESVGPGKGIFNENYGGFADPNTLMINKLACNLAPHLWNTPMPGRDKGADRYVFDYLARNHRCCGTNRPSVFYAMNLADGLHAMRLRFMGQSYDAAGLQPVT